jgi:protein-disulfide isomerase
MSRYLPFAIIAAVFIGTVGGGTALYYIKQKRVRATAAAAAVAVKSSSNGAEPPHVRGDTNAPVTLEEFGDFQCQPCGDLSPILEKMIEQDYGAHLRVIFRQFPLAMHRHALNAARASEAAGLQGRFWEMHDLLYHERFNWPRASDVRVAFGDYAKKLGLDVERFKKDMDGERVNSRIMADRQRAVSLRIDRTPVLFINNRQVPVTSLTPPGLHAAIDAALNGNAK